MWVEMSIVLSAECARRHPLREDVSWNNCYGTSYCNTFGHPLREDVSWNTLICVPANQEHRHPLREDVSWNTSLRYCRRLDCCHPLREDVSWNFLPLKVLQLVKVVILFVRMWVEMTFHTSLWIFIFVILFVRMWVEMTISGPASATIAVILFVRMWVEIPVLRRVGYSGKVILFVRMWVEISLCTDVVQDFLSSSSWGCELKCITLDRCCVGCSRHPLREDVSWNNWLLCSI